jgi:hypothetical protein
MNATLTGPFGREQISRGGSYFSSLHLSIFEPFVGLLVGFWFTPKVDLLLKADWCGHRAAILPEVIVPRILQSMAGFMAPFGVGFQF